MIPMPAGPTIPRPYRPTHFTPEELFPRLMFERFVGAPERLWAGIDPRVLVTLDMLRDRWGVALIVNDWHRGGKRQLCGWRPWDSKVGATLSQHKWGRAADVISPKMSADAMRADLLANPGDPAFQWITRIEGGTAAPTWFHFDVGLVVREAGQAIVVFNP